jgi:SUN domain-containing protein 1/2
MDSVLEEVRRRYMMLTLDTVGKPDFALRSNGAKVVREKTFATYTIPGHLVSSAWMHSMGLENGVGLQDDAISVWVCVLMISTSSLSVCTYTLSIFCSSQASTAVGRCWAMQGSTGDLTVELARPVVVRSVTLDHTDFRVATHISTAPRDFQVWVSVP